MKTLRLFRLTAIIFWIVDNNVNTKCFGNSGALYLVCLLLNVYREEIQANFFQSLQIPVQIGFLNSTPQHSLYKASECFQAHILCAIFIKISVCDELLTPNQNNLAHVLQNRITYSSASQSALATPLCAQPRITISNNTLQTELRGITPRLCITPTHKQHLPLDHKIKFVTAHWIYIVITIHGHIIHCVL